MSVANADLCRRDGQGTPADITPSFSRSDTYTIATSGTIVDCSEAPPTQYALQVRSTTATASAWNVRLEGSLDGVTFTTILTHTQVTGDGVVQSGNSGPFLFFRSRLASVTLGSATNLVVTVQGVHSHYSQN